MLTDVTAAVAAAALVAILVNIGTLLARASRWPDFTEPPKHAPHPDAYRPRSWDEVTADTDVAEPEDVTPISAPPADVEPIDELDPRWDWRAYADALDKELVEA